ncbi:TPA: DUF2061 domain-containing protein [Candidatus Micrarchaeota archaeon]|nr:DUF2061 domain-containing protein [Candidatus Micrarchaeota archaeon]
MAGLFGSTEKKRRSFVKAVTYRIIITALNFLFLYFLTGSLDLTVGFVVVSSIYTTAAYFLHERLWDNSSWGKN